MVLLKVDFLHNLLNQYYFCEDVRKHFSFSPFVNVWLIAGVILIYIIYRMLFIPSNWTRDLTEVGFGTITRGLKNGSSKSNIAFNRRVRNIGSKLPPPFPNGWFALTESENIRLKEVTHIACLGQNFVVFRGETGQVNVLDAYCPHLGANLGIGGKVHGNCIECPFHHWSFRGSDGECMNVPYSSTGNAPKTASIKKWISSEIDGSIFVWHHADGEQPWPLPKIKQIDTNDWVCHGRNEFTINCHIQEIPENGADVAHLSAVHGSSILGGGDIGRSRSRWWSIGKHVWQATWQTCCEQGGADKHMARMILKHSLRLFNKFQICSMDVCAKQIGPSYVQLHMNTTFGEFVILQTVTPIQPLIQKVVHRFYGPRLLAPFIKFVLFGESIMFERDVMIWNHKMYIDAPNLVKEDRMVKAFRYWFKQFYSENSKSFVEARNNNLDW